jgi:hypothetical protein
LLLGAQVQPGIEAAHDRQPVEIIEAADDKVILAGCRNRRRRDGEAGAEHVDWQPLRLPRPDGARLAGVSEVPMKLSRCGANDQRRGTMPIQCIAKHTFVGRVDVKDREAASLARIEPEYRSVGKLGSDLCRGPAAKPFWMFDERFLPAVHDLAWDERNTMRGIGRLPLCEGHDGTHGGPPLATRCRIAA